MKKKPYYCLSDHYSECDILMCADCQLNKSNYNLLTADKTKKTGAGLNAPYCANLNTCHRDRKQCCDCYYNSEWKFFHEKHKLPFFASRPKVNVDGILQRGENK